MATEFISIIKSSGGDYTTLQEWETACDADLTNQRNRVYSHGGITGTIVDGETVTESTSGYTAVVYHCTSTQIYVYHNSPAQRFTSGRTLTGSTYGGTVTLSESTGDQVIAVAEIDGEISDSTALSIGGWTLDATHRLKIRSVGGVKRSSGVALRYGSASGRWTFTGTGNQVNIFESYVDIEDIDLYRSDSASTGHGITIVGAYTDVNIRRCCIRTEGLSGTGTRCVNLTSTPLSVYVDNCVLMTSTTSRCMHVVSGVGYARNVTCYNMTPDNGGAFFLGDTTGYALYCTNCYGNHRGTSGAYPSGIVNATFSMTTCASSDNTGSTGLQSFAAVDQFTSLTAGSEDFRLLSDADLIDVGTTITGMAEDICGTSRPTGYEDIGAYEYAASGIVVPKFMAYYRQRRR